MCVCGGGGGAGEEVMGRDKHLSDFWYCDVSD